MLWKIILMRLLAAILLCFSSCASACTIPVFRYALDRWEADKFHLVLPAASAQDAPVTELLRPLRANGKANLDIETSKDKALTNSELRFSTRDQATLWKGPLDQTTLEGLLDSPARQQIRAHILAGDSIVWVMADHGTPEDELQAQRLEKRLKFLEQVATLPIQNPNDPDSQLGPGPPLKLKFTLLRFRSDDPAERVFANMLAGPKALIDPAKTSFAAAVFGRGRVLGAWPLDDLDDAVLEDASMFLVGRCSCRIKNENPGWDILMNADWGKELQGIAETIASAAQNLAVAAPTKDATINQPPATVTIHATAAAPLPMTPDSPAAENSTRTKIALAGSMTALIGLAWLAVTLFKNGSRQG